MLSPPPLRNDCFALPEGIDWMPVSLALERLKERMQCCVKVQTSPLDQALGAFLAQEVSASNAHPPHANAAVDGFGFDGRLSQKAGALHMPLAQGRAAAGHPFDGELPYGEALRVLTGAPLPAGVDTVILQEDVSSDGERIAFNGPLKRGANTRNAGEDVTQGKKLFSVGHRLEVGDLALLTSVGVGQVQVFQRLKIGIMSTGDELQEIGQPLAQGQIFDANRPMLLALIDRLGYEAIDLGRASDDCDHLRAVLNAAAQSCDVVLSTGGASDGDEDHMSGLLNEADSLSIWRVAVKPGRPIAMGVWNAMPVFGLPGNPVAALVCALIFASPALRVLAGGGWVSPQPFLVPAGFRKTKKPGRVEYLRARIEAGRVVIFPSEGSGRVSGLSWAQGLVELGAGPQEINAGDPVRYIPFSSFRA